ncbi:YchJ family protein [Pedobacter sp. MW01-1-1]|uniref:YchJ family protein n=1 Tax=Pedobacter sp. MW01-1-1 TaxID=3383027 RepID=UPI003FEFC7B0
MNQLICPCGTGLNYANCCQLYHLNMRFAPTAEALMRSRYTAFVMHEGDYLVDTTHVSKRQGNLKKAYLASAKNTKWLRLEILLSDFDTVEFKAHYVDSKNRPAVLHEKSNFRLEDGKWYYLDGRFY